MENNWDTIVSRLDIDPITKNLAKNILFVSKSGANIDFLITKNLLGFITKKSEAKLQEALTNYFKLDVNINIKVSEEQLSTLHKNDEDDYNKKISDASNQIENDDFVKIIKEKFDATSVENSVKVKETIKGD